MQAILEGNHVVTFLPTGSGKKLLYLLPALITKGLTIVIVPYISLLLDLMREIRSYELEVESFSSQSSRKQVWKKLSMLINQKTKTDCRSSLQFLLLRPEFLACIYKSFRNLRELLLLNKFKLCPMSIHFCFAAAESINLN